MDRNLQQHSQIHPDNYSFLSVYEQYHYSNAMLQGSSATMPQNQPVCNTTKMEFQQNRPIYATNSAYLPPSQQANEYTWTHLENTNSILHKNQPYQPQNIKMMSDQYAPRHSNVNMYSCEICKSEFATKHSLDQHRPTHLKEKQHFELSNENAWDVPTLSDKQSHVKELGGSGSSMSSQQKLDSHNIKKQFVCKICGKALSSNQSLTTHVRIHTGEKPFFCKVCAKRFTDNKNLNKHFREHTGEKPYTCNVCKEKFARKAQLHRHKVDVHIGQKPFPCDLCDKRFLNQGTLNAHLKFVHDGEKPYECEVCSKSFRSQFILDRHKPVHTGERPYSCEICNLSFKYKSNYNRHLKINKIVEIDGLKTHVRIKNTKKEFSCDLCSKAFTTRPSLVQHKRRHKGEKPFVCQVCNVGFVTRGSLNAHAKLHSEEHLYVCHRCDKSFLYKCLLDKHNQRHDQPGFKLRRRDKSEAVCKLCNLPFLSKISLNRHLRNVHQEKPYSALISSKKPKESITSDFQMKIKDIIESKKYLVQYKNRKKLYLCPVCDKKLTSKQSLVNHTRIHTGEKPFACKVCEKKFTDKSQLNQHLRKHSEKFLSIKSKHFIQSSAKNIHKCSFCSKTFLSVSSMISHRYTHILKMQCFTENILQGHNSQTEKFQNQPFMGYTFEKDRSETCVAKNKFSSCNICKETFSSIFSLIKHKRLFILKKRYVCDLCKELFISKSSLELHLSHHKNRKSFACDICQSKFHKQSLLNMHLKAHDNGKLFTCKICQKTFLKELAFQKHENLHIGRILYVCRICNKHLNYYYIYNVHIQSHTNTGEHTQLFESKHLNESKSVSDVLSESEKQKKISTVKKAFTDKKLFVCAMCPKSFDDRNACIRHMKLHTKTHACWICDRKFDKEKKLMSHMQTHVGKPYVCGMCPKSFSDKSSCVNHMKIHTQSSVVAHDIQARTMKPLVSNICYNEYSDIKNMHDPRLTCTKNTVLNLSAKVNIESSKVTQNQMEETNFADFLNYAVGPFISSPECHLDSTVVITSVKQKDNKLSIEAEKQLKCDKNVLLPDQHLNLCKNGKLFSCAFCKMQFSGSQSLENHVSTHTDKKFSCEICKRSYLNECTLKIHEKSHAFVCEICDKVFKSRFDLKLHISAMHSDIC